jgi:ABC-2 type transport system ATP-binding protein
MNNIAISAENLSRNFGKFVAVDRVNFSIAYGEIFGFLGSNGAGKSTTIRMLCGILAPTSGTAHVAGFDVNTNPEDIKKSIGYVSQRFSLYQDLTVEENLQFFGDIYGIAKVDRASRMNEVLAITGLEPWRKRLAQELSGGWKQKLALANSILHRPKILFLDEPTAGIDPISRRSIWELLYQIADGGVALFVTTHYMEEAERCNQIAFISRGKLLKSGSPEELRRNLPGKLLEVSCHPVMKGSKVFGSIPGVLRVTAYGTSIHLNVNDTQAVQKDVIRLAEKEHITISSIEIIDPSLEDVFATIAEGERE